MKNLRKVLALVLAVVMTVTTFTVAFAAETEKTSGEILKALGLVVGNEDGDLMEDATITRAEAAQIIVKVMNWDLESADSYTFEDATWAKAQAATLVKKGITSGVGNNNFGGADKMDALQVYAWVYAAITGDTASAWANPDLLTKILSADEVAAVVASKNVDAKRSEIFKGMVTILTTEVEGKTQLDRLIEAGKVDEAVAIELGLKEAPVTTNAIVSAELLNYKELKVVFTKEASDDETDYTVKTVNDEFDLGVSKVVLSDDKKEATLILTSPADAQAWLTVDYDDGQLEDSATVAGIIDSKIPAVVGVNTTNKNTITLTFDEAIKELPTVKVNDGKVYAAVKANGVRKVDLTILNAVPGTTYKLEVSLAQDFADLYMAAQTLNHTYEEVTDNVTVSVKKALSDKLVLELNRPTTVTTVDKKNFTYILNQEVVSATVTDGGKTITLVLFDGTNGYAAPTGNWALKIKDADKMFIDSWGNKPASAELTIPFSVVIDETAPTVKSIKLDQDKKALFVVFDETVVGGNNPANYEVRNAEDKVVSGVITGAKYVKDSNDKEVELTVDNSKFDTATYTLVIKKAITDESKNPLAADVKMPFDAKYKQALDIKKVEAIRKEAGKTKTEKIYVTYSSDMPTTALDAKNWLVVNNNEAVKIKTVAFEDGSAKVVVITTEEFDLNGLEVSTSAIVDALGNRIAGAALSVTVKNVTFASGATVKITANAIARDKVEIVVEGRVNTSTIDIKEIKLDGVQADAGILIGEKDGNTVITLHLNEKLTADLNGETVKLDIKGIKLTSGVQVDKTGLTIQDKIKPELLAATATLTTAGAATGTATIVMDFSEDLVVSPSKSYFESELVLTYDEKVLVAGTDYEVDISDSEVIINVKKTVVDETEITVKLAENSKYVSDGAVDAEGKADANPLAAFEKTLKITN